MNSPVLTVSVPVFALDVNEVQVKREALRICRLYVGKQWNKCSCDDIVLHKLSGLTNYVFKVSHRCSESGLAPLLLRIHGSAGHELVIETVTASILAERNYGPQLYGIFPEGRLEEFVESERLGVGDLYDVKTSAKIARKAAQFHQLNIPVMKSQWMLLQMCEEYFSLLHEAKHLTASQVESQKTLAAFDYKAEIQFMKQQLLTRSKSPVVFCHNDMQEGNMLRRKDNGDLLFIDYEYSCYNYRNFDIINHFLEWIADYEIAEEPYFSFDHKKFPSEAEQKNFLTAYFSQQGVQSGTPEMEKACQEVVDEIDLYSCYSHLVWTGWGICVQYHTVPPTPSTPPPSTTTTTTTPTSSVVSEKGDTAATTAPVVFDYFLYAVHRMNFYKEAKQRLLNQPTSN